MSVQVSYKKQTVFFSLFLIIILVGLEIIANLWWINETKCAFTNNEIFAEMDQERLKEICQDQSNLNMNKFIILPNQDLNSIHINNLGFRGPDFEIEKEDRTYRIFFVGGSTAFGSGSSSDNTTIPGYLQILFDEIDLDFRIQVINAGKDGGSTLTEKALIFDTIQYLEPNMIIMYDGWNDIRADYSPEFTMTHWNEVCDLGRENKFESIIILQPTLVFGKKPLTTQEYANYLIDSDHHGFKMTLKKETYNQYADKMKKLSNCTNAYDLRDVFENTIEPIYYDGGHMSDNGNKIIAKKIFDLLENQIKNSKPNKNSSSIIKQSPIEDPSTNTFETEMNENTNKIINFGRIYLQLKGFLTFYKTPVFIESFFK